MTVLMAVYNGERYLKECMDSVISQTFKDFEFLIIDDGSTDSTSSIIRSYSDNRIRVIRNAVNLSQVASLNIGLDHAQGEYIARIDADDAMLPDRLKIQIDFLKKRKDLALCGSYGEAIDERGGHIANTKLPVRNEEIAATALFGGFVTIHSAFMFRKKSVADIGKYNEVFSFAEDYKLVMDLLLSGYRVNNIPKVLVRYRFHDDRIGIRDSKPQIARAVVALRDFLQMFTGSFSKEDKDLLFNLLMNAESLKKSYWDKPPARDELKRILGLSGQMLSGMSAYFKFGVKERYFAYRVFYNRLLNFAYQALFIEKSSSVELYKQCLKNFLFIMNRPKLYAYPAAFSFCGRKNR
ncbi:MAG: glycosyltransferase [Candidatus Omnitrophica bacterium]|nr:glycosyltransferase [Candidatus Omnitrophota bacterium]